MVHRTEVSHKVEVHVSLMMLNQSVDRCIFALEVLLDYPPWLHHTKQSTEGNRSWTERRNRLVGKFVGVEEVCVGSDSKVHFELVDFLFEFALQRFFEPDVDFSGRYFLQHCQRGVPLLF